MVNIGTTNNVLSLPESSAPKTTQNYLICIIYSLTKTKAVMNQHDNVEMPLTGWRRGFISRRCETRWAEFSNAAEHDKSLKTSERCSVKVN